MPTFPSRQFYLARVIGTGTPGKLVPTPRHPATMIWTPPPDPFRPKVWDMVGSGDRACVHTKARTGWIKGTQPSSWSLIRALVTTAEHQAILATPTCHWCGFGETDLAVAVSPALVATLNSAGRAHVPAWATVPNGMTVIPVLEWIARQVSGAGAPPGGRWWPY